MTLWARALRCEDRPGVAVDPATFGPFFNRTGQHEAANTALALTSNSSELAVDVLRRIAERFRYVRDDGIAFPVGEPVPEAPHWTASDVSEPLPVLPVEIVFDTEGQGHAPMLRTFLQIAIEEVIAADLQKPRLFSTPSTIPYLRATWDAETMTFGPA